MLPKSLSKLSGPEYVELKFKRRTEKIVKAVFWIPISLLIITTYVSLAIFLLILIPKDWNVCLGIILFYGGFGVLGFLLDKPDSLRSIFNFYYQKTALFGRLEYLTANFTLIEKQVELEAVEILAKVEMAAWPRLVENANIRNQLKHKRKWRPEYAEIVVKHKENFQLNSTVEDIVDDNLKYINFDTSKKYYFRRLLTDLRSDNGQSWLGSKVKKLQSWVPTSPSGTTTKIFDLSNQSHDLNVRHPPETFIREGAETKQNVSVPSSSATQVPIPDVFSLDPRETDEVPRQRKTSPHHTSFKISDALRSRINNNKMEIGRADEAAVVVFEKQRLMKDSNNAVREPKHVSLTNDAAGYDIQSWDGGREIRIEVKTTVGDFWSNLYFTQNEFETMQSSGERYYLYRICNFDRNTGKGDLFIYAGKDMIVDTFEFNSKMYLLSERAH